MFLLHKGKQWYIEWVSVLTREWLANKKEQFKKYVIIYKDERNKGEESEIEKTRKNNQ